MNKTHTYGRYNKELSKFQWGSLKRSIHEDLWVSGSAPKVTGDGDECILFNSSGLLAGNCSEDLPYICQFRESQQHMCKAGQIGNNLLFEKQW